MRSIFTFFLLTFTTLSFSQMQLASLTGSVWTDAGEPAIAATLMVLDLDSNLVKASITDDGGQFEIANIPVSDVRLKISYVGFEDYYTEPLTLSAGETVNLPRVSLRTRAADLAEVVVKATRPIVEVHPDKTVFNVEGSINATGSNALELLQKSPGVIVDNNDNIILQGKNGVKVYINGKPSPLGNEDLANFLKAMQSTEIDNIEIITNPSAKYDAEGNAGIINIRLKKDKRLGANATINSGVQFGEFARYSNSISANYRNRDLNWFASYSNYNGKSAEFINIHREQFGYGFTGKSDMINENGSHSFKVGSDFFLSQKSTLGVLVDGYIRNSTFSSSALTDISPLGGDLERVLEASNEIDGERNNFNFNLNYVLEDRQKGQSLSIDADYGFYRNDGESYQPNIYYSSDRISILDERVFTSQTPTDIDIYTFKSDYEQNLWGGKLGTGVKFSWVRTDNTYDFFNVEGTEKIKDLTRSNNFVFDENINAGYLSYQRQVKKFNLMAGLRVEHTHSKGDLTSEIQVDNEVVERDYVDFFPSAGLTYQVNDNNTLRFNYSRRIDRPSYQDLNPFEFKLDELTFQKGNAFLNPQYSNNYSLSHTYKYRLNTTLSYTRINDFFTEITDTQDETKTFLTTVNLATSETYTISVSYPFGLTKWWNVYANATAYHKDNKADFGGNKLIDVSANVFSFYAQNSFSLPKDFKLEVSGWYSSPALWGGNFETDAMWSMDIGIQRKLFKDRGNIKVAVSDVFLTQRWRGVNSFGDLYIDVNGGNDTRRLRVNFTYLLGNNQVKQARNRKTGLEEEQSRVKGAGA